LFGLKEIKYALLHLLLDLSKVLICILLVWHHFDAHTSNNNLLKISLVLLQNKDDLCVQISNTYPLALKTSLVGYNLEEVQVMILFLPQTYGSVCEA
jgi:hypothetical protein